MLAAAKAIAREKVMITIRPLILLFITFSFVSGTTMIEYFFEIKPRFSGVPPTTAANLFSILSSVKVFSLYLINRYSFLRILPTTFMNFSGFNS
jgi:hypothetical protein